MGKSTTSDVLKKYKTEDTALAFRKAASEGDVDSLEAILLEDPLFDVNAPGISGKTALYFAISNKVQPEVKKLENISYLLEQGADPKIGFSEKETVFNLINELSSTSTETPALLTELCLIKIQNIKL